MSYTLPASLAHPGDLERAIGESARAAMDAELPSVLTEIVQEGAVPADRGTLRRAVLNAAQPARLEPGRVVADLVVGGEAAAYAAVQDLGRRPGKPMSWRVLYYGPGAAGMADGWRTGWVNRKMRAAVVELGARLAAEDASARRGAARQKRKPARKLAYERRAAYLIAVSVTAKIRARGMAGKRFIDGNRARIGTRVRTLVAQEIGQTIRRLGTGGGA